MSSLDHWQTYTGPSRWYQLKYPPSWSVLERDGVTLFRSPDGNSQLQVKVNWSPQALALTPRLFARTLKNLFPVRRLVRRLPAPLMDHSALCATGEARTAKGSRWWQQWFSGEPWLHWRLWLVSHNSLLVTAVFIERSEYDPEEETLAGAIVSSIALAESPCDPPNIFAETLLALATHRFPHRKVSRSDTFQLIVDGATVSLTNFYRAYLDSPEHFDDISLAILNMLMDMQRWNSDSFEPALETIRDRIMPMLLPEEQVERDEPKIVAQPWVAGLAVMYVVDGENAYWYIRPELLTRWGLKESELHDLALANLDRYFEERPMEVTVMEGDDGPKMLIPTKPDAYNASRLLSEKFQRDVRDVLGGRFAAGIPNRDFFVAVGLESDVVLSQVRSRIAEDFQQLHHPLTTRLLLVSMDGVSELVEG